MLGAWRRVGLVYSDDDEGGLWQAKSTPYIPNSSHKVHPQFGPCFILHWQSSLDNVGREWLRTLSSKKIFKVGRKCGLHPHMHLWCIFLPTFFHVRMLQRVHKVTVTSHKQASVITYICNYRVRYKTTHNFLMGGFWHVIFVTLEVFFVMCSHYVTCQVSPCQTLCVTGEIWHFDISQELLVRMENG